MTVLKPSLNALQVIPILLGRFSAWLGAVVAPVYVAVDLLGRTPGSHLHQELLGLPLVWPQVGLGLAVAGLALARALRRPVPAVVLVGLALNAVPMAMALWRLLG